MTILAHPDTRRIGEYASLSVLNSGQETLLARGEETLFSQVDSTERRGLADPHLSRSPLRLRPIVGTDARIGGDISGICLDVGSTRTQVATSDGVPITGNRDFSLAEIERGVVLVLAGRVALLLHLLDPVPGLVPAFGLVGESSALAAVRREIERLADSEAPVLLRGATGTGKELVARAIHRSSTRRGGSFVAVNMGALSPAGATAEFFGVAKGAEDGADQRREGYFVRAQGGTLFLDELGAAPLEVQVMLLRMLEECVVQPVGCEASHQTDVRIIAASEANLEAEIAAGRFREPLLHHLCGYEIRLPPLSERRDDIPRLLVYFLRQELAALGEGWRLEEHGSKEPWLPASMVARLVDCEWSGNVRQLKNVAHQLVIANRGRARLRLPPGLEELLEPPSVVVEAPTAPKPVAVLAPWGLEGDDRSVLRTLLLIDLVDSTRLVDRLGDRRALKVMSRHDRAARALLPEYDGYEIDKSDGFLLLFERPADAVGFALEYHETTLELSEELGEEIAARSGICLGEVYLRRNSPAEVARGAKAFEVEGLSKPVAARLMAMAGPRQTFVTRGAFDLSRQVARGDHPLASPTVRWKRHGEYRLKGVDELVEICEIGVEGTAPLTPPMDSVRS